jgi:hypothetical protein
VSPWTADAGGRALGVLLGAIDGAGAWAQSAADSPAWVFDGVARAVAVVVALQAGECLWLSGQAGVGPLLRGGPRARQWLAREARCAALVGCAGALAPDPLWTALALLATVRLAWRWGGAVAGASDALTVLALLGLLLGQLLEAGVGLAWIRAHLVVAYGMAGLAKLRGATWREGSAPWRALHRSPLSEARARGRRWAHVAARRPRRMQALAAVLVAAELLLALALLLAPLPLRVLAVLGAAVFHALVARTLGLVRFAWIWWACLPAALAP